MAKKIFLLLTLTILCNYSSYAGSGTCNGYNYTCDEGMCWANGFTASDQNSANNMCANWCAACVPPFPKVSAVYQGGNTWQCQCYGGSGAPGKGMKRR